MTKPSIASGARRGKPATPARGRAPAKRRAAPAAGVHPHAVPILRDEEAVIRNDDVPDVGPELRERMASETAFRRYDGRQVAEGDDIEHLLEADVDVERELVEADKPAER